MIHHESTQYTLPNPKKLRPSSGDVVEGVWGLAIWGLEVSHNSWRPCNVSRFVSSIDTKPCKTPPKYHNYQRFPTTSMSKHQKQASRPVLNAGSWDTTPWAPAILRWCKRRIHMDPSALQQWHKRESMSTTTQVQQPWKTATADLFEWVKRGALGSAWGCASSSERLDLKGFDKSTKNSGYIT